MKPITVVALNLVTIAVALAAYDVIRSEPDAAPTEVPVVDTSEIEGRLDALEVERRRSRRAPGIDQSVLERLAALEAASAARQAETRVAPESDHRNGSAAFVGDPVDHAQPAQDGPRGEPTSTEIAEFRRLQDAVRRQDVVRKNAARIDRLLDALPVNLTDDERKGVHTRWASFQPRVNEIWTEVKQEASATAKAGGQVDRQTIVSETQAVISAEFAEELGGLLGPADSSTIAYALVSGGK